MLYLCILFRRRNFFSSYNLEILSRCIVSNLKKSSWNVGEKFSSLSMTTTPLPHHDGDGGGFFFLCPFLKKIRPCLRFHHSFRNVNDDRHQSLSWLTLFNKKAIYQFRLLTSVVKVAKKANTKQAFHVLGLGIFFKVSDSTADRFYM